MWLTCGKLETKNGLQSIPGEDGNTDYNTIFIIYDHVFMRLHFFPVWLKGRHIIIKELHSSLVTCPQVHRKQANGSEDNLSKK